MIGNKSLLRMVGHWSRLPREADAASLEEFKAGGSSEQHDLGESEPAYGRVVGARISYDLSSEACYPFPYHFSI